RQTLRVRPADPSRMAEVGALLHEVTGQAPTSPGIGELAVPVDGDAVMTRTVALLAERGIGVTELALHLPGLDEVFTAPAGQGPTMPATRAGGAPPPPRCPGPPPAPTGPTPPPRRCSARSG